MTSSPITHAFILEIGMKNYMPYYKSLDYTPIKTADHLKEVKDFLFSLEERTEYKPVHQYQGRPERDLDIYEQYTSGSVLYVFELDLKGLENTWVLFPENPPRFIEFPMNFPANNSFLVEEPAYSVGNRRRAAFSCDLDALRSSDLATRVKNHGDPHHRFLKVPFYFSFWDQFLGAAPWIIPDHSRGRTSVPLRDHEPEGDSVEAQEQDQVKVKGKGKDQGRGHEGGRDRPRDDRDHPRDDHDHPGDDRDHPGERGRDRERGDDREGDGGDGRHGRRYGSPPTHGGVHPSPLAFYDVPLE